MRPGPAAPRRSPAAARRATSRELLRGRPGARRLERGGGAPASDEAVDVGEDDSTFVDVNALRPSASESGLLARDGLESEIAIAPRLLAYGGGAPYSGALVDAFQKGEVAEGEKGAEGGDGGGDEDDDEEDASGEVEFIHDRDSLKKRSQKIVQKRTGRSGRRRSKDPYGMDD